MNTAAVIGIGIAIVVLIGLSALFSFSEMALATVNKIKVKKIANSNSKDKKRAKRALKLINSYNESITSIVIMNNIVNILATTLSAIFFVAVMNEEMVASLTSFLVMTFSTITFGELTPKMLAKRYSLKGTLYLANVIWFTVLAFKPITIPIKKFVKDTEETLLESDDDIKHALTETHQAGHIDEDEKELLHNALDMDEINVRDIMIPIKEVESVKYKATINQIKKVVLETSHTRIPVFDGDQIIGILNTAMFTKGLLSGNDINIDDMIYDVSFFKGKTKLDDVLNELRTKRQKLGIVTKENEKDIIGIVTIEDILEELVGELYDESDVEEDGIMNIDTDHFIVAYEANAKQVLKEIYNSQMKVDPKEKFGDFVKRKANLKKINDGDRITFKNSIIWVRNDEGKRIKEFEIDVIN